jgi:hypothetical protein
VVVYHGNAGAACDRAYYVPLITGAGAVPVLVEYSGYSDDPTPPSHTGIKTDVSHITNWLEATAIAKVTVIGESIGSGPAVLHASLNPPDKLILITPFTSLRDLAKHHYWYFPTDWLVQNAFDNLTTLSQYQGPRTIIHGTKDAIVPYEMSEALTQVNPTNTTLVGVAGANHNNLLGFVAFNSAVTSALRQSAH